MAAASDIELKEGLLKEEPSGSNGTSQAASSKSLIESKQDVEWWKAAILFLVCGLSWVASIPMLLLSITMSLQPLVGWVCAFTTPGAMFAILVQVDQKYATIAVFIVCFSSAIITRNSTSFVFASIASFMMLFNGIKQLCGSCPQLLDFQSRAYASYHKRCALGWDTDSIQPGKSCFACHPHGMTSVGWITNVLWNKNFHQRVGKCYYLIDGTLRNKGLFARLFCDAYEGPHGGLRDNSRETMKELLQQGESVCLEPGAYQEATAFIYGRDRVALKNRAGFVKYCLQKGYRLHPVYTFGESETYYAMRGCESLRFWLNNYGIPTVAFVGMWWCPVLPRADCELLTFIGPAIELPTIAEPSSEEVKYWHEKYMTALKVLYDKHKAEAGKPNSELDIL